MPHSLLCVQCIPSMLYPFIFLHYSCVLLAFSICVPLDLFIFFYVVTVPWEWLHTISLLPESFSLFLTTNPPPPEVQLLRAEPPQRSDPRTAPGDILLTAPYELSISSSHIAVSRKDFMVLLFLESFVLFHPANLWRESEVVGGSFIHNDIPCDVTSHYFTD